MVITLDTMVAIWAVRKSATVGQEHKLPVAASVLKQIDSDGAKLILTAPVVSEYLCGFGDDDLAQQLRALRQRFFIQPFDVRAAEVAAKLTRDKGLIKGLQDEFSLTRQHVKADVAVIASAIAGNAKTLISDEPQVRRAAQGLIVVKTMEEFVRPESPTQKSLLGFDEPPPGRSPPATQS